jgi:hypothetical protein
VEQNPLEQAADTNWIRTVRTTLQHSKTNFFRVRQSRYWFDFLLSLGCGYTAGAVFLLSPFGSWPEILAFPIAVFWLYRLGSLPLAFSVGAPGDSAMPCGRRCKLAVERLWGVVIQ